VEVLEAVVAPFLDATVFPEASLPGVAEGPQALVGQQQGLVWAVRVCNR